MLTYVEFVVWIGMWFMMATIKVSQRHLFWSRIIIDTFNMDPYRFNNILTQTHFEELLKSLIITDKKPPAYKDTFW